ncbi:hypothetical protein Dsin_014540 [Dipteronia sinensis]|uniref:YqgF/RNase H-like domain-containing protein n=1 Tax=Dipteronia sinensis TaxID=43782 RepID=A0AAE0EBN7_9ROSI|nr:hypothetical protein Dsin_014540 [Dipteronia sinensis]
MNIFSPRSSRVTTSIPNLLIFAASQNRTENSSSPRIISRLSLRGDTTLFLAVTRPSFPHDTVYQMEYLKPLNFYEEIFKDILIKKDYSKPGRLLGLDVSDKYVSLAVSDCKNKTALPLRALDRHENNLSSMAADIFQSLNAESVFKQHLKFILENLNQPMDMSKTIMEKGYAVCALQKEDDPGKFRQLEEIIFINGYPGYQHLFTCYLDTI